MARTRTAHRASFKPLLGRGEFAEVCNDWLVLLSDKAKRFVIHKRRLFEAGSLERLERVPGSGLMIVVGFSDECADGRCLEELNWEGQLCSLEYFEGFLEMT